MRASLSILSLGALALALAVGAEPRAYPSAEAVQPLSVGSPVPSVVVHGVDGAAVDLAERVREGGALLVFYRGGW